MVRVHYTRYWTVTRGAACVAPRPAGWTAVTARAAGTVRVARFSLGRALGLEGESVVSAPITGAPRARVWAGEVSERARGRRGPV